MALWVSVWPRVCVHAGVRVCAHVRACVVCCLCVYPPPLCPSNAYVQATLGFGCVNFCTVDFGGATFNSLYCVQCVLPGTLVLRSTKCIFCVKGALLAKRAFVACFTSWFSE